MLPGALLLGLFLSAAADAALKWPRSELRKRERFRRRDEVSHVAAAGLGFVPPAVGEPLSIAPVQDLTYGARNCEYVLSANPLDETGDFDMIVGPALNGFGSPYFSIQSQELPGYYWTIVNASSGALGIAQNPNIHDATFEFRAPLSPLGSAGNVYTLVSASNNSAWKGTVVSFGFTRNMPCGFPAPCGDIVLLPLSIAPPMRASWVMGNLPPAAVAQVVVDGASVTNGALNRRFMGCHSDYGFAQTPRGFYADMIYGSHFEPGTMAVPAWVARVPPNVSASVGVDTYTPFSSRASMEVIVNADNTEAGLVNRGIGGAGFYLEGGKPYTVEVWIYTDTPTTAFVELRDFTTSATLAREDFTLVTTGPHWGSTWMAYNVTLTPKAGTECVGIAYGSDPTIDCGVDASPGHVCLRCGGEFVVGLSAPGDMNVGRVSLMPGAWGLLQGPLGSLPVLQSGADLLTQMGVTVIRSGGSVSQSMRWKDWRGPAWNRPSATQTWAVSLLAGWGPFEVIDMANTLGIEPIITLAYDTNDVEDWADLIEYCWGDVEGTTWGARRGADGHPAPYNVTVWELGNEQYNPFFVQQVMAMEARAQAVGAPPQYYMFPQNAGLSAEDAQRAIDAGLPIDRILPDLHVGAYGAVEVAAALFANPPVPGFNSGAINCETNADSHDHLRALQEAADLIDWFTADPAVTGRLYARTASFCTSTSSQFDYWDQGIAFFLPNMTWLQPPGYVHQMISETWAEQALAATVANTPGNMTLPFAAHRSADGKTLVLRTVTAQFPQPLQVSLRGVVVAGPTFTLHTLTGFPSDENTPSEPTKVAPVRQTVPVSNGATELTMSLPAYTFAIAVVPLV